MLTRLLKFLSDLDAAFMRALGGRRHVHDDVWRS